MNPVQNATAKQRRMIHSGCEPRLWREEWNNQNIHPTWAELTADYQLFLRTEIPRAANVDVDSVIEIWWNNLPFTSKRIYFITPEQINGMQSGNPYMVEIANK